MLRRCSSRLSQQSLPSSIASVPSQKLPTFRLSSSTSERSRKFPGSEGRSKLKLWQKRFLIGGVAGFVIVQATLFYNRQSLNNSFITYKLVAKEPVSSTASIFHLEPKDPSINLEKYKEAWKAGIWNVQIKQPQIQIVRAYTPLPTMKGEKEVDHKQLRFLIRHDPYGEVSSYLHRLPLGAEIDLRGPYVEYKLTPDIQQVVFFAGGTGIAPALQIAHAMFEGNIVTGPGSKDDVKDRKLHILWASRKREDCIGGKSDAPVAESFPAKAKWSGLFTKQAEKPVVDVGDEKGVVVQELEELKRRYPGRITVEYFVNAEDTFINESTVMRSLSRFDDKDFSSGQTTSQEQRQILLSGPSGFISYLAGPKEWKNGKEEQGNVSKIIAHAIAQNPHHVKVWKV